MLENHREKGWVVQGRDSRIQQTKKKKKKNITVKSVRRNAELTSFTFYTSAVAHIINITV